MRTYLREKIVSHILEHPNRGADPATDPGFVPAVLTWLEQVAQTLHQLRQPLVGSVRSQITLVSAATTGIELGSRTTLRRVQAERAVTALTEVQGHLVSLVHELDEQLNDWSQRLSQILTVAAAQNLCPIPETPGKDGCRKLWLDLAKIDEIRPAHTYLSTVVPRDDLLHILNELLTSMLGWGTWGRSRPDHH